METIKLKDTTQEKARLDSLLKDFSSGTTYNPFNPSTRIWQDSIRMGVSTFGGKLYLDYVGTSDQAKPGDASKALDWLLSLADKHHVDVSLSVVRIKQASKKPLLTTPQLKAWYMRHGFTVSSDREYLTRKHQAWPT